MKMNKNVRYGMLIALFLAKKSEKASIGEIAEALCLPPKFLTQIAAKMSKEGLLESIRGLNGGYKLAGDPTLKEIFDHLGPHEFLADGALQEYQMSPFHEKRALASYFQDVDAVITMSMKRTVKQLMQDRDYEIRKKAS